MANTICLSTDMQTLYLIKGGVLSTFSLAGNGVTVQLQGGDINAIAASNPVVGPQHTFSTNTGQGTIYFDDTVNALEIIGVWDMLIQRESFPLSGRNSVNIKVTLSQLIFTS